MITTLNICYAALMQGNTEGNHTTLSSALPSSPGAGALLSDTAAASLKETLLEQLQSLAQQVGMETGYLCDTQNTQEGQSKQEVREGRKKCLYGERMVCGCQEGL